MSLFEDGGGGSAFRLLGMTPSGIYRGEGETATVSSVSIIVEIFAFRYVIHLFIFLLRRTKKTYESRRVKGILMNFE